MLVEKRALGLWAAVFGFCLGTAGSAAALTIVDQTREVQAGAFAGSIGGSDSDAFDPANDSDPWLGTAGFGATDDPGCPPDDPGCPPPAFASGGSSQESSLRIDGFDASGALSASGDNGSGDGSSTFEVTFLVDEATSFVASAALSATCAGGAADLRATLSDAVGAVLYEFDASCNEAAGPGTGTLAAGEYHWSVLASATASGSPAESASGMWSASLTVPEPRPIGWIALGLAWSLWPRGRRN